MALLSRLLLGENERPTRPSAPLAPATELWDLDLGRTDAGRAVSEHSALQVAAVWRAVNIIAGTASSLPLKTYADDSRTPAPSQVVRDPHPDLTQFELFETLWFSLLLWGNSYHQKIRNRQGQVIELWPLPASQMQVGRVEASEDFPGGKIFKLIDGEGQTHVLTSREVFHVPGPGYDGVCGVSPIRLASQGIGMSLAAEEYGARLFGSGSMLAGILQTEQRLDATQAEALKERWRQSVTGLRRSHEIAVLGSGASFQPVTMPNRDAQFLESRKFQVTEIARWFGIPPHLLFDVDGSTSWGTGIEHQSIGFVVYTLRPWLTRVEQRVTKELLGDAEYAEFTVEGLLRGDSASRAAFYQTMVGIKAMNANEVRARENLEPYDGGEVYANPNITTDTGPEGLNKAAVDNTTALIRAGFEPEATAEAAGLPAIPHTGLIPITVKPEEELAPAEVRALMGRLSRQESLEQVDREALVAGMNGHSQLVLDVLETAISESDDVAGFRERLRALGPKENA